MQNELHIRRLYRPVQPTVRQAGDSVYYREMAPDKKLDNLIHCYWELRTAEKLSSPFVYRVVADGCIDIFFELSHPSENFVMGFCKQYTEFPLQGKFHYIGIRFFPTSFPSLFKINAKELSNRFERLELVVKEASDFIANSFSEKDDSLSVCNKLDSYFLQKLGKTGMSIDNRFAEAFSAILENQGAVSVQKDLDIGLSPRQLRRYFEFYVGDSAKTFSQVVRFQHILHARPSAQSLKQNKIYYDLGYFDQAHFIKEFKNFYGLTPGKAFEG
ncbi:MAG TPA: helix-turn-helix domain-containing protein [Flavisolibacter sp.]|nr:helix-turn-helix domain-containing protein [Flavisolibacter sp.]